MPDGKPRPPLASIAAIYAAIGLFCASMLLSVFSLSIRPGFGILIGVVVSMPFFALGVWLAPADEKRSDTPSSFWPAFPENEVVRKGIWSFAAILLLGAFVVLPYVISGLICLLLPGGDAWATAVGRNACFLTAIVTSIRSRKFAEQAIPAWFRGKLSNEFIQQNLSDRPRQKPASILHAFFQNLPLAGWSLAGLAVATGALDRIGPLQQVKGGGKFSTLMRAAIWYQTYPNTARISATLVFFCTTGIFVLRMIDSLKPEDEPRGNSQSGDDDKT